MGMEMAFEILELGKERVLERFELVKGIAGSVVVESGVEQADFCGTELTRFADLERSALGEFDVGEANEEA